MKKILSKWYLMIVIGFLVFAALVFGIFGEDSIIAVHDNLDLFIAQFQMMKNTGTFFAQDAQVPFLGGISRDNLPAEFSLYTMLFMLLPSYWAYITGYLLKIVIAVVSCILLAKDFCGERYETYSPLVYMTGLAYGILNVFPAFGIPFASIPLVIFLLRKIYRKPSVLWYLALLCYPLLSYFSYFGLFILAYMAAAFIWLWIKDKKFPGRILIAILVLSAGYIGCEYRLFGLMLFGDTETIRATMEAGSFTAAEIIKTIGEVFAKGMFHAESVHTWLVMPVCILYFLYLNISYIKKNKSGIFHDTYNLLVLILVFNSAVYGIYYWEGFRSLIETICPPLTGWQFNRTVFFNPFLWYAAFFLVLKRLYDSQKKKLMIAANILSLAAVLLIVFSGTRYNDLYHTCVSKAYEIVKGKEEDQVSYREFYSTDLFEAAKEDIGYCGQWSAAYGFHPAVLEYNDISTIDGYLGFYGQRYKEEFRKVIAPALERVEASRDYFDTWGARAYLYPGTDLSVVSSFKSFQVTDQDIYIDMDAFKALGGRYIFSRIELTNAEEAGLALAGVYTHEDSPYTLYVYQTESRYQTKEHAGITFEEMKNLSYNREQIEKDLEELDFLAGQAEESGETTEAGNARVIGLYEAVIEEINKMTTCRTIAEIESYRDVFDEEKRSRVEEILEDVLDINDSAFLTFKRIFLSPYREAMETILDSNLIDIMTEYEEMADREKEIYLQANSLEQEYEQAVQEEYTISYQGEEWNLERLSFEGGELEQEEYLDIYLGIYEQMNAALGEIFLELVALRNERAQMEGYDNYAEYAYSELYVRDYTVEEAKELFAEIKKKVVPVISDMRQQIYEADMSPLYVLPETTAYERLMKIRPYLNEIDKELGETFDYMQQYQLYDMDEAEGKAGVGFTTGLSYYNDAFIFDSPNGNYYDYTTAIHEFGHYHYMFRNTEDFLWQQNNVDLCEIHSQGLEMLYYDYGEELLSGEAGELFSFMRVCEMAANTVDMALISEFEIQVYEHPNMSLESMNKLYLNLSNKYGIYYVDRITEFYNWVEVSHIFSSPCYCISYLTSAFSSLDILALSEENRQEAVEKYMELTTLPSYAPYCDAIEYVGLKDIFEKGVPEEIINKAAEIAGIYEK